MIKLLLKHTIYETCIDVLFNGIRENMCPPVNELVSPYMWDVYDKLKQLGFPLGSIKSCNQFRAVALSPVFQPDVIPSSVRVWYKEDLQFFYNKMAKCLDRAKRFGFV